MNPVDHIAAAAAAAEKFENQTITAFTSARSTVAKKILRNLLN